MERPWIQEKHIYVYIMQNVCPLHAVLYPPCASMYDPIIREIHEGVREGEKSRRKMGRKSTIKKRNGERRREKQKQGRERKQETKEEERRDMGHTFQKYGGGQTHSFKCLLRGC